jgi:hypothetical protein
MTQKRQWSSTDTERTALEDVMTSKHQREQLAVFISSFNLQYHQAVGSRYYSSFKYDKSRLQKHSRNCFWVLQFTSDAEIFGVKSACCQRLYTQMSLLFLTTCLFLKFFWKCLLLKEYFLKKYYILAYSSFTLILIKIYGNHIRF